ncbi:MAG: hypothetical protein GY880_32750 [Planctomycetaceae bacterium]|nr:hypothetical protein [Planctomycetaceae bacterium]MCP4779010.1 hypothetical protein [Planctomycetaceae bacterium]
MNESNMLSPKPTDESTVPSSKSSNSLGGILAGSLVGGLIGSYLLGPYGFENATPYPYIVGFGFGALPTLILLLLVRFTFRHFPKKQTSI